jgi:hypothetical protein
MRIECTGLHRHSASLREILTADSYALANRACYKASREYCVGEPAASTRRVFLAVFLAVFLGNFTMSLSSAKNYALRAERSQDAKEAADLLAKAILELAAAIEATDAKVKKMNKSG